MSIPITGRPTLPDLSDPASFNARAQALLTWVTGSMLDQFNAVDPADWFAVQSSGADLTYNKVLLTQSLTQVFTGAMMSFAMPTPPTGWLKANGAAVSRSVYSDLFGRIGTYWGAGDGSTTFNVPDARALFLRGWDDGRGLDAGRAFASYQDTQNLSHNHDAGGLYTGVAGNHNHTWVGTTGSNGGGSHGNFSMAAYQPANNNTNLNTGYNVAAGDHQHSIVGSTGASGGGESRPRNIAALICIKY